MAYGLLAGVDPVVGIYTAFFPVLLYAFLGTMPHVSMGTFAVISILVSKPVTELSTVASFRSEVRYRVIQKRVPWANGPSTV